MNRLIEPDEYLKKEFEYRGIFDLDEQINEINKILKFKELSNAPIPLLFAAVIYPEYCINNSILYHSKDYYDYDIEGSYDKQIGNWVKKFVNINNTPILVLDMYTRTSDELKDIYDIEISPLYISKLKENLSEDYIHDIEVYRKYL